MQEISGNIRPSDISFHVLKWFNGINPRDGTGTVQTIAYLCGINEYEALSSVKELWNMGFIRTAIPGVGEWNGHYVITDKGRQYVRTFAT
jgi:predicted transcriptional regulator